MGTTTLETSIKEIEISIDKMIASIDQETISNQVNADNQKEIGYLVTLLKKSKRVLNRLSGIGDVKVAGKLSELKSALDLIKIAIDTLKMNPSMLTFAQQLRYSAAYTIDELVFPVYSIINNPWRRFWRQTKIPSKILLGLLLGIGLNIGLGAIGNYQFSRPNVKTFFEEILPTQTTPQTPATSESSPQTLSPVNSTALSYTEFTGFLIWVWFFGTTGSMVSIFWRVIDDKDGNQRYSDDLMPIYIGVFKPIVGGISGVLFYFVLSSQLLPITLALVANSYANLLAMAVIAFVSGFSERLLKDIIGKTTDIFGEDNTQTTSPNATVSNSTSPPNPIPNPPLPPNNTLQITPAEVTIDYGESEKFEITPTQTFPVDIVPSNLGIIVYDTNAITYTAPTEAEAKEANTQEVRMTLISEDKKLQVIAVIKLGSL